MINALRNCNTKFSAALKALTFILLFTFIGTSAWSQVLMSTSSSHNQTFDALISTGSGTWTDNSTIANWYAQRTGTGTTIAADAGSGTAGNLYSYGAASASDRALGSIGSSNAAAGSFAYGVLLQNTSGGIITDIKVSYTLEQWRNGAAAAQALSFFYKTSSSTITALNPNSNGTWTAVAALNLSSPIINGTAGALVGNNSANKVSVSNVAIPSLSLANGSYIMLKWDDPDHTGTDHGLSIDDVTITWTVTPTSTATLANITQPSGSITQGTSTSVLSGFTLSADASSTFSSVTVSTSGTATSTDITNVQIFRDNDGNGAINGADAAVSASALAYAASMNFTISGETGITTARNYLIVADIAQSGVSTPGRTVTASVASGAFVTTAGANVGSATGNSRTLSAPNPTKLAITNINPASPFTNTAFSVTVQAQDANGIAQVVTSNTSVTLSLASGTGNLTGTLSGVIGTGTNQVIITGVLYDVAESGVSLTATRTAGDVLTAGTSANFTVTVNVTPTIFVSASLTPFSTSVGTPSSTQNYSVSGSNLTAGISIAPPANFEVSDNGGSSWTVFPNSVTIPHVSGTVSPTTIQVRYNPASAGSHSGNIQHTSSGATQVDLAVSGTSIEAQPTVASTVTFGTVTGSSIVVNFTGGNGANRIVVASSNAISFVPTDGAGISGTISANFSSATDQGSGNKVVYSGSGNTVTVTNLSGSTAYNFAVYEFNGSGVTANYYTTPGTGSSSTIASEPTTSSTTTFTRIKETELYVSFTGGNGSNRIVVVNTPSVTFTPVDGTSYSGVNANYATATDQGSGNKIVYSGSATSVIVTGLTRGTIYNVQVYELNGTGATINYLTSTFGNATGTTPDYISYSTGTYSQNFSGISASGTFGTTGFGQGPYYLSTPPMNATGATGWQISNQVSSGDIRWAVDAGATATGSMNSYGTGSSTERALGAISSGSNIPVFGAVLINNSGGPLSTVTITYNGEQWRYGAGVLNTLAFEYQVGSSSVLTGTFTGVSGLDFSSVISSGAARSLDGNDPLNRIAISYTFTLGSNWLPGQTLAIRWKDTDNSGADDGLAVDDFTFSATGPQTPTVQDENIAFFSTLTNATSVTWTPGDGTSRIVKMNTVNSFTDPVDGNTYSANTVYGGGEQVVFDGSGSFVSITNLTPSTQYFFRVYGYNGTGVATKYNTNTATLNPNDVTTAAPSFPTQLVVLNVNNGQDVIINQPFTITIQAQDGAGSPQNVTQNTTIDLSVFAGFGTLLSGNTSDVMTAGTNTITITGVIYDFAEMGVTLNASATAGDVLTDGQSPIFTVYDVASQLFFSNVPANGVVNQIVNPFDVYAVRPDASIDNHYSGSATITVFNGPGTITGTLTVPFVGGVASFTDIVFNQVGNYTLEATSGSLQSALSPSILINPPVAFTELAVPKYMGSKTTTGASGTNTNRTPIAVCFQIDNLAPNTSYNVAAGLGLTSEASTALGAGSIWNGTAFSGQTRNSAFTTDANGSSGPVWIFLQPSGNQTRFGGGEVHNVRIAYQTGIFSGTITPNFVTTKTITALDIATTAITTATTDDGAFLTGALSACMGGKYIFVYDNVSGTGDPLFVYQSNPITPVQTTQSTLPTSVDQIWMGTAAAGTFAAVYPIGANNPNGIRRVEARDANNTIVSFATSVDGTWPGGTNTANATRRQVKALSASDVSLSSVAVSASATNVLCFGGSTGTLTASGTSANTPVTYLWLPNGETTSTVSSVAAGTYSVTVTDAVGCTASQSVTVTQPTAIAIVGQVTNTGCAGGNTGAVDITVTGGVTPYTYSWSNSETTEDISGLGAGTYTVTVTDANSCTASTSFTVITQNSNPSITVTATPTDICVGQSSTLEATGATSYTWSPSGSLSSSTGSIVIATPSATTTYSVVAIDGNGCQSIGTVTVNVNTIPNVGVTPVTSSICEGSSVNLTATGATTYSWNPTTGLSPTTGATVTATPSVTTIYTVTGTSSAGCTATATATINVTSVAAPAATSPVNYCQGATTSPLTATATGGNQLWWYTTPTGGNASATAPTPSTTTPGTTTYYVSQQASNPLSIAINGYLDNGSPDEYTFVALSRIPAGTVIYFTDNGYITGTGFRGASATDANGSEGFVRWTAVNTIAAGTVIRSAVSTADYTWNTNGAITCSTCTGTNNYTPLDFAGAGDQIYAFTSTATDNPLFNVAQQIHLYVFDDTNGFETSTSTATGAIPPGLTSGVTANTFAFASSNYVNLINDGQTRSISAWRTYMALPASYTTGTGTNPGLPSTALNVDLGCESPRTAIVVNVNASPVVSATSTPILCNGGSSTVTVSATNGTVPYTGTGSFTVNAGTYTYSVTDVNGCSGSTTITVTEPTALSASAVETIPVLCNGGSATVTVSATGGTAPYTGTGVFTVGAGVQSFTVSDANGCTTTASVTITQPAAIVVSAVETTPIACPGGMATITVSATGGNGVYTGTGTFTVTAGTYTYTVTDGNGCTGSTTITVSEPAAVAATSFVPTSGCPGSTVSIFGSNFNLVTGIDLNGISAIFVIVSPGEITVTIPVGATSGPFNLYTAANCVTTTSSNFTVTTCNTGMVLNLKAYLQGYYIGGGMMQPVLANQLVPNATGLEADSISIELYDENTFAFVSSMTTVLMIDGTSSTTFNAPDGNYYVAVRHRNSVLTWSATPVAMSSSAAASFDFTTDPLQSFAGWMADDLNEGIWSIFSGDLNQDEFIDASDFPQYDIDNAAGLCCDYYATDLNGDGFVDASDFPVYDTNNSAGVFSIHP